MKSRRRFLLQLGAVPAFLPATAGAQPPSAPPTVRDDRGAWVARLARVATPVLTAAAAGRLHAAMPVESRAGATAERAKYTHLEALGRLLAGMAPWLETGADDGDEGAQRRRFADLARRAIDAATDPASPDVANFTEGGQPLVDAAFLAHAILRAPGQLWRELPTAVKGRLAAALTSTRVIQPGFNNWLLFSAMVEAGLCAMGERWDTMRVDYALRQHEQWYKGDGLYGDGPEFHWDYYNSYVIQPMMLDVLRVVGATNRAWEAMRAPVLARARRYAAIQERLIAPDGSFPVIGRSIAYRCGAFQLLAQVALMRELDKEVSPAQVRGALTAVIQRTLDAPATFDDAGWLRIGLAGHQPSLGEVYISTGSLYLCTTAFLPLGLPRDDPFWAGPAQDWTSRRAWSGKDLPADHALS